MALDAYMHVGLPRFQSARDALKVMDDSGIGVSVICPFETCPDLATVHGALRTAPDRFVGVGIPLGDDRDTITSGIRAQFAAGFRGLRLSTEHVRAHPWILDLIGEALGFALMCGRGGLEENAGELLRYLDTFDDGLVLGGHFAGPTDVSVFESSADTARLFEHERFAVILSRHGLFPEPLLTDWMGELLARLGWGRILWGSEAPVLYWRDESMSSAMSWIERFAPMPEQRAAFLGGNLERLVLSRPSTPVNDLALDFDPFDFLVTRPSEVWPKGLPLDDALVGRLVHQWLEWGGSPRGTFGAFTAELLESSSSRSA
jgi:hypothetical protein